MILFPNAVKTFENHFELKRRGHFYGLIDYATPDVAHQEQNVVILRYVFQNKETSLFEICERFIEFKKFSRKTLQVPLADCLAQGTANGSNMRGHISGVQSRILEKKKKNEFAIFSPCGAHSLNRVGVNAAKLNHDPWFERLQAVRRPIVKDYPSILKVIDLLLEDTGLLMSSFWYKVLSAVDQKNVIIQGKGISLNVETRLIKDLLDEMESLRDSWEIILQKSKVVVEAVGIFSYFVTGRRPSRLPNADENTIEEKLQLEVTNEFKSSVMFPVLDFIMADLKTRFASSQLICDLFSPILTMHLNITISTAERCFSRMANSLKTWQGSTTSQNRLNHFGNFRNRK
ncbi:hypothetical protein PR048_021782 [Dryococelus australis]|uniref:Uncharacterized protein n=1 Tax=Dryococelus australis TaxID=614101 RepID=A0ABQ9GZD3_9NEOP|nr:hypothetical protein PR048_021782 [Dryococelus australis]